MNAKISAGVEKHAQYVAHVKQNAAGHPWPAFGIFRQTSRVMVK